MLRVLVCVALTACAVAPDSTGSRVLTDSSAEESAVPDYAESLGDQDDFTHACDLDAHWADLGCVREQLFAVEDDIDACARAKGVSEETIEEQRWSHATREVTDEMTEAEVEHLVRHQDYGQLMGEVQAVLPCRAMEIEAETIQPFLAEAWLHGGCAE